MPTITLIFALFCACSWSRQISQHSKTKAKTKQNNNKTATAAATTATETNKQFTIHYRCDLDLLAFYYPARKRWSVKGKHFYNNFVGRFIAYRISTVWSCWRALDSKLNVVGSFDLDGKTDFWLLFCLHSLRVLHVLLEHLMCDVKCEDCLWHWITLWTSWRFEHFIIIVVYFSALFLTQLSPNFTVVIWDDRFYMQCLQHSRNRQRVTNNRLRKRFNGIYGWINQSLPLSIWMGYTHIENYESNTKIQCV